MNRSRRSSRVSVCTSVAGVVFAASLIGGLVRTSNAEAATGDVVWSDVQRPAGFQPVRFVDDSATDSAGNVYVTGRTGNAFPPTNGDALVAKYSPTGSLVWSTAFGSDMTDEGRGIAVTPDGATVVVAGFLGNPTGPTSLNGLATFSRVRTVVGTGWSVARFDGATGAADWIESWDEPSAYGFADQVEIDAAGGIYVSGFGSQPPVTREIPPPPGCDPRFDPDCHPTTVPYFPAVPECVGYSSNSYCRGVLVAKLTAAGDPVAAHVFKPSAEAPTALFRGMGSTGADVWLSGECLCSNQSSSSPMPDSTERGPAWIARYTMASLSAPNTVPQAVWVHQYGGWIGFQGDEATDLPNDVAVDATGNLYIAGERQPQWSGYARSYGPTGTMRWDVQLGGVTADDFATDIALDNWGNVFAVGRSTGVIPGAPEVNLGGVDGFVAQLRQSDGSLGWRHMFGTSTDDGGRAIVATGRRVTVGGFADANLGATGTEFDVSSIVRAYENDLIAPLVEFSTPAAGGGGTVELGSAVTAAFACGDPGESGAPPTGSGIDQVGGCPDATSLDTGLHFGEHAAPRNAPPIARTYGPVTATDVAGNSATFSEGYGIVDTTVPTASVSAPTEGAEFVRAAGATTIATFSCSDLDLKTCRGSVNGGTPSTSPMTIPIDALGSFVLTVTGSDWAGNTTNSTVNFTVVAPPVVVPGGAGIAEGNVGSKIVQVPVRLSRPSGLAVTVRWRTSDGAGQPAVGVDYVSASGTVTFAPGETVKTVSITVRGDTLDEVNEWIPISFSDATNATIGGTYGLGFAVILDDD